MKDERYESIYSRLSLLNNEQRYDTYNYEESTGKRCALAKVFDIPEKLRIIGIEPTQDTVLELLKIEAGPIFGTVKGLAGEFYVNNRESDLKNLCRRILDERIKACDPLI